MTVAYAAPARAEYFQFESSVTILSGYVPPGSTLNPASASGSSVTLTTPGGVGITLGGQNSFALGENIAATGAGSDIVFGSISVSGLSHNSQLEEISLPYVFHVVINDYASYLFPGSGIQGSGTFDIMGIVSGTVGRVGGGSQVNLSLNIYDENNILSKFIGGDTYTLTLNSYVPPGPTNTGAFGVHVHAAPEPSSIAMAAFGGLAMATSALWRRRRISRR